MKQTPGNTIVFLPKLMSIEIMIIQVIVLVVTT